MNRINLYVFIQIFKSCTLVFFIFLSIAWLLQMSRLFSIMNNLKIELLSIIYLSFFLIPNIINILIPFIIIFGLLFAFIKLDRDKELIAMFSLGISIKEILKPLFASVMIIITIYLCFNFYISPYVYEKYKIKEYEIRNLIDLENIDISNFIQLNSNLVLDFKKENGIFEDILISYEDDKDDIIIFAKEGNIINDKNNFKFLLINGYKLNINKENNEIEKLEFKKYKIDFPTTNNTSYDNFDKNTQTILNLVKAKDYITIFEKIFEIIILLIIILFFYYYLILENNFNLKRIFQFLIISILSLIFQNIIKNVNVSIDIWILLNLSNFFIILSLIIFKKIKHI